MRTTLLLAAAAVASTCTLKPACDACGGTFDAVGCTCGCPFSRAESIGLAFLAGTMALMLLVN